MLLFVKVKNGLELTWDSLDSAERATVLYAVGWTVVVILGMVVRASRERLKEELRVELAGDEVRDRH